MGLPEEELEEIVHARIERSVPRETQIVAAGPKVNIALETDLLAQVLRAPEALDIIADITKPEHFYSEFNEAVWNTAVELAHDGQEVNVTSVRDLMHKRKQLPRASAIQDLVTNHPIPDRLEKMAARLRDVWRVRRLHAMATNIANDCCGDVGVTQAFIEKAEGDIAELAKIDTNTGSMSMRDSIRDFFERVQAGIQPGAAMGLTELDDIINLQRGELTLVAGRPGMGKTALMMQVATAIAATEVDGFNPCGVVFFTLEMSNGALVNRTMSSVARVDSRDILRNCVSQAGWSALYEASAWLAKAPLYLVDHSGITPHQVRSKCRRLKSIFEKEGRKLSLVVIDYIQLMSGFGMVGRNASREEAVAACSKALKGLAKELNVPIVAGAQLNRPLKGKVSRPQLTDLRESGSLEQDADNVIFIHRPEYYLKDDCPEEDRGVAELIVAKQRNGDTGIARTRFYAKYTCFADLKK